MKVILLEKNRRLGNIGDVAEVKAGYGRNYLLPQKKAVSATPANLAKFEAERAEIERKAQIALVAAQERANKLLDKVLTISAKTGEEGRLFGSIGTTDIAKAVTDGLGVAVTRSEVKLPHGAIRQTGEYTIDIYLHSDVVAAVKLNVVAEIG